jgi:hypothetical protein
MFYNPGFKDITRFQFYLRSYRNDLSAYFYLIDIALPRNNLNTNKATTPERLPETGGFLIEKLVSVREDFQNSLPDFQI